MSHLDTIQNVRKKRKYPDDKVGKDVDDVHSPCDDGPQEKKVVEEEENYEESLDKTVAHEEAHGDRKVEEGVWNKMEE